VKKLFFFLTLIFVLVQSIPAPAYEMPETVKIGLFYSTAAKESVVISCPGGVELFDSTGKLAEAPSFTFMVSEGTLCTSVEENSYVASGDVSLFPINDHIRVNDKQYRGIVILKADTNGKITVINEVNIEEYLYSVLPKEMSSGFPYEALKAQAVCARTYTINNIGRFKQHGFDLTDNTLSQVYGGVGVEADDCTRAVEETRGQVMTYEGKLAETYYFATSSGKTLNVKDVWGSTKYPYLISVEDTYQSVIYPNGYKWEVAFTASDLTKLMNDKGFNLGTIKDVTIDKVNSEGAVMSLTFVGERGTKTYTAGNTRTVLGLKSQVFEISKEYSRQEYKSYFIGADGLVHASNPGYMISSTGVKPFASEYAITSSGIEELSGSFSDKAYDKFVVYGTGYGHGIGMSQNGAKGMARSGFTYDQILTHYFPGCIVE